jgi:hypothetical protein
MKDEIFLSSIHFFPINVYRRHNYGSQLQPKHVAVNKLIKTGVVVVDLMHLFVIC